MFTHCKSINSFVFTLNLFSALRLVPRLSRTLILNQRCNQDFWKSKGWPKKTMIVAQYKGFIMYICFELIILFKKASHYLAPQARLIVNPLLHLIPWVLAFVCCEDIYIWSQFGLLLQTSTLQHQARLNAYK